MMIQAATGNDSLWMLGLPIVGILLIIISLFMGIRKRRHASATRLSPREQIERNRQHGGMRRDLERLMVEIETMAKHVGSQLDAKAIRLERLLDEAEAKTNQLEQISGKPASAPASPPLERPMPDIADPGAQQVYALADQGRSPMEIARQLNEHVGKIELILSLRKA